MEVHDIARQSCVAWTIAIQREKRPKDRILAINETPRDESRGITRGSIFGAVVAETP
jgi:hypothetical protein